MDDYSPTHVIGLWTADAIAEAEADATPTHTHAVADAAADAAPAAADSIHTIAARPPHVDPGLSGACRNPYCAFLVHSNIMLVTEYCCKVCRGYHTGTFKKKIRHGVKCEGRPQQVVSTPPSTAHTDARPRPVFNEEQRAAYARAEPMPPPPRVSVDKKTSPGCWAAWWETPSAQPKAWGWGEGDKAAGK